MHESLRLYQLCAVTEWAKLPVEGGLYDQDSTWLEHIMIIRSTIDRVEKEKQEKKKRNKGKKG